MADQKYHHSDIDPEVPSTLVVELRLIYLSQLLLLNSETPFMNQLLPKILQTYLSGSVDRPLLTYLLEAKSIPAPLVALLCTTAILFH